MDVIDLHCHVLPGIDDGPATIADSTRLARAAAESGTSTMVATPHVSRRYPNQADSIAALVQELDAHLRRERVAIEIRHGAEIAAAQAPLIDAEEISRFGLGGGPWLLVEPPFAIDVSGFARVVRDLLRAGHRIVLAHPERCPGLHRDPQTLRSLVRSGVLTSITASSFSGRFGHDVRRFALALAAEDLVHNVASDAHDHLRRPPGTAEGIEHAGLGPLREWLTLEVPAAILDGREQIPSRPAVDLGRPRTWRRRLWPPIAHR
jgi:protein-tyrosine phosphatase